MKTLSKIGLFLLMTVVTFNVSAQNSKSIILNNTCKVKHDVALLKAEVVRAEVEMELENAMEELEKITVGIEAVSKGQSFKIHIFNNSNIKKGFFFMDDYFEAAPVEQDFKDNIYDDGSFDFLGERFEEMPQESVIDPVLKKGFRFLNEEYPAMPAEQILL